MKSHRRCRLEFKLRHNPANLQPGAWESQDSVERSRWPAIWLPATGHSIPEVAQTLGPQDPSALDPWKAQGSRPPQQPRTAPSPFPRTPGSLLPGPPQAPSPRRNLDHQERRRGALAGAGVVGFAPFRPREGAPEAGEAASQTQRGGLEGYSSAALAYRMRSAAHLASESLRSPP